MKREGIGVDGGRKNQQKKDRRNRKNSKKKIKEMENTDEPKSKRNKL